MGCPSLWTTSAPVENPGVIEFQVLSCDWIFGGVGGVRILRICAETKRTIARTIMILNTFFCKNRNTFLISNTFVRQKYFDQTNYILVDAKLGSYTTQF